ncbi:phosphonate ABC transporter, permease protein PhnE [Litoreibacter roseus]|uniref:Phosphonate ABC transporter, permease protein PhnE n=1 Tax=Litoreibacter roseus TaxID=2601869 RepID=A0A6N6JN17_9RHOB|nr:phosphonate ABC transporter, permease protein PhnE [Litoreibacter roseus]GFE67350.1 phosphonate ABC transporter, permease protein PhnE [Litoreibacter roseus]
MTLPTDTDIKTLMEQHPRAFRDTPAVRARKIGLWALFIGLFAWCLYDFNFAPERIWVGLQRLGTVISFMFPPHLWETWPEWVEVFTALGETVAMAFLGTVLGLIIAFPVSFLGAKNINRIFWLRHSARRGYDIIRAFETLILALIFIRAFGLGPLAGILAIAVSEIGTFGKLFSEALENTSKRPVEGVVASGGSRFQSILYGIMPQVLPVHLSIILYNFESNVRSSTILGIVGAGGIGFMLSDRIAGVFWDQVWTIIFMIIAMVYMVDYFSGLIRTRVIGKWEGAH